MKVIVVGGGASGIAAALTAAKNGADTLLVESESTVGGDLCSGMPVLGAYTSRGECCVHGILDEIVAVCRRIDPDSCIGPVCDWRSVYGLCFDPTTLHLAMIFLLQARGVKLLLNATVCATDYRNGLVRSLKVVDRKGAVQSIECDCVVDASGGGHITMMSGGDVVAGSSDRQFQPVSLVFRMIHVAFEPLLKFIRDNPDEALLGENPVMGKTSTEAAQALYDGGYPYVAIAAKGLVLGQAIADGVVHPCTALFMTPTSMGRGEVCMNATRIAGIDCTDDYAVSAALLELSGQLQGVMSFVKKRIPGFENAALSSIAHRVGVRETGRITGEYTLTQDHVVNATRHSDGVARGAHHVDIHGAGTAQVRIPVKDGLAYDIPYRCLIPQGIKNVIVAGRCLSSDRGANGSARVMGTCIATGQAAGLAASIFSKEKRQDFRNIDSSEICEECL